MKRLSYAGALLLITFCQGCASLNVDVRAFDRDCLQQLDFVRAKALDRASHVRALEQSEVYQVATDSLLAEVRKIELELQCVGGSNDPRDYCLDKDYVEKQEFSQALGAKITAALEFASEQYRHGIEQTDAGEEAPRDDVDARQQHYAEALESFYQGDDALRTMRAGVRNELEGQVDGNIKSLETLAPFLDRVRRVTQELASGARLFDDHLASAIVAAHGSCWDPKYNNAYAFGLVGNSDVAIKMEAAAEYSIKGVRLDAAAVTKATFGAVRQGIAIAAAAYGVPLPTAKRSKDSNLVQSIPELDLIKSARQEAEVRARLSKMAMLGFLEAVVLRRDDFEDTAKRKPTFQSIQSIFAVYRPQLAGESTQ